MTYLAFIFALALACVAGMEFVFLMSLETSNRRLKRRVRELESENAKLSKILSDLDYQPRQQKEDDEEAWPEVIDDNSPR
jgi:hypothetical protein